MPHTPRPLAALNTRWDDYNSAAPPLLQDFVWSTNRGSEGKHFDLWTVSGWLRKSGLDVREQPTSLTRLASDGNEFGPFYAIYDGPGGAEPAVGKAPLVFASDRAGGIGKLDLYVATSDSIAPLNHLNSEANDAYWCAFAPDDRGAAGAPPQAAYFASDRGGNGYDIYEVCWPNGKRAAMGSEESVIRRVEALSSKANDTAVFAFQNAGGYWLVFASNRAGGFGGFDLYLSSWNPKTLSWTAPKNLGRRYNSKHNEFRPVATRELFIFSSDRPGGAGGYDLYYATVPALE